MSLPMAEVRALTSEMSRRFTTDELLAEFRRRFPDTYDELVQEYGPGGKGAGTHFSSTVAVTQALSRSGVARFVKYIEAPEGWGNPLIAVWRRTTKARAKH